MIRSFQYRSFQYLILLLLTFLSVASCIDEITLDIDTDQRRIAIDGFISDSLFTHKIEISYSSILGLGNDNIQEPITGATVEVMDGQGNTFRFEEGEPGQYERFMAGEVGESYHIEIELADGKNIRSTPITMPEPSPLGGVDYQIVETTFTNNSGNIVTEQNLEVKIDAQLDPVDRPFLRWRTEGQFEFHENYRMALSTKWCYIPDFIDFNNLKVLDAREVNGNELKNQLIVDTPLDHRFAWQYAFHISQFSMSQEEYQYWKNTEQIINTGGSLFDPPPGTVIGNLSNPADKNEQILGFFSVASVSFKRSFCNPDVLGRYIEPRCRIRFNQASPPQCMDCLLIFGSSLEKPSYWIP